MKTALLALGLIACVSSAACLQQEDLDPMTKQAKYRPYSPNPYFSDGRAMRTPPPHSVPRERNATLEYGVDDTGAFLTSSPLALTPAVLALGHKQFDIHCAICHGAAGDGHSLVSTQMSLKTPPNLIAAEKRALPDGRIFNSITNGYGLMNGYAADLTSEERWAVIAYLRALQRSQSTTMADVAPEARAQLEKEAQQ